MERYASAPLTISRDKLARSEEHATMGTHSQQQGAVWQPVGCIDESGKSDRSSQAAETLTSPHTPPPMEEAGSAGEDVAQTPESVAKEAVTGGVQETAVPLSHKPKKIRPGKMIHKFVKRIGLKKQDEAGAGLHTQFLVG